MKKTWTKPVLKVYSTDELVANISAYASTGGPPCGTAGPWRFP